MRQQIEAAAAQLVSGMGVWWWREGLGLPQQLTFMVDMTGASGRFVLHMQALSIGATFSTDMHSGIWSAAQWPC